MTKRFTGKHMATVLVAGFGVVVAVNFTMAALASSTFGGVTVRNSYVASQKFNGWLEEAKRSEKLGWTVDLARGEDGRLAVSLANVPQGARVSGYARQPLGLADDRNLQFSAIGEQRYVSEQPLDQGRWTVRLKVTANGDVWKGERALP